MAQQGSASITSDDKLWAALGYPIVIIAVVMLLLEDKKKRPFIKFHAIQAIALNVVLWVVWIIFAILIGIIAAVTLGIGSILGCIYPITWLLLIWPAILAFQGQTFDIPVITKFLRGQHWVA